MAWQSSISTIQAANLHLLESEIFSDVTFVVGTEREKIRGHTFILMTRSAVFQAWFQPPRNNQDEFVVPNFTPLSFRKFLKYLYANAFLADGEDVLELLYMANEFDTNDLQTQCSKLLEINIHIPEAIKIHDAASLVGQRDLESKAMAYILRNGVSVLEDEGFLKVRVETFKLMLKSDQLASDELTVFRAAMRWAENKCVEENTIPTTESIRKILIDLIHLIRFPLMSSQEFSDQVIEKHKGILTDSEILEIRSHFNPGAPMEFGYLNVPFSTIARLSAAICSVDLYDYHGSETGPSCRTYKRGRHVCEGNLRFVANMNIRVTAVELYPQTDGALPFAISICPTRDPEVTTVLNRRNSSNIYDLENVIDLPRDVFCVVRLRFDGEWGRDVKRKRGVKTLKPQVDVTHWSEVITFSFSSYAECCTRITFNCISNEQIKAIHFHY